MLNKNILLTLSVLIITASVWSLNVLECSSWTLPMRMRTLGVAFLAPIVMRFFSTCQQLGVHAFRQHGLRALESMYVQSAVCPGCLKNFHTTYRVSQHLRYRANQCWERIFGVRQPADPGLVTLPPHLIGVHRLPAVRQHHGPLRPTAHHRECHESIERLRSWRKKGDATLHGGAHLMMSH